jgi:hypothetical protein
MYLSFTRAQIQLALVNAMSSYAMKVETKYGMRGCPVMYEMKELNYTPWPTTLINWSNIEQH